MLFQKVLRAKELEEFNEARVVTVIEEGSVIADVEPCVCNLVEDLRNEFGGDFLIEEIRFLRGKGTVVEVLERLD